MMPASPSTSRALADLARLAAAEPPAAAKLLDEFATFLKCQDGPYRGPLRAAEGRHRPQARRLGFALERALRDYEQECDELELPLAGVA